MSWRPAPETDLFRIKRYDRAAGSWTTCSFADLKDGDIYAAFAPSGTHRIDPGTGEETDDEAAVARCVGDAYRNEASGQGYQVKVFYGRLEDHLAALAN